MSTEQQSNPETGNSVAMTQSQGSEKFPQPLRVGQATTSNPTTTPQREKNPKRVAAGKLVAERTRQAREQQKKAAAEAAVIIANNKAKKATPAAKNPVAEPKPDPPAPVAADETSNSRVLSTTQWLAVISIVVSLIGIYYKREELQTVFGKSGSTPPPKDSNKVDELQPVRLTVYGKNTPRVTPNRGVKHLD